MTCLVCKDEEFFVGYKKAAKIGYLPFVDITPEKDVSFSVYQNDDLIMYFPCFILDGVAGWCDGTSSVPIFAPEINSNSINEIAEIVNERMKKILYMQGVHQLKMLCCDTLKEDAFGDFNISDNSRYYGYIDLTLSKDEIWKHFRKSYQSLINKGAKLLHRKEYYSVTPLPSSIIDFLHKSRGITDEIIYGIICRLAQSKSIVFAYFRGSEIAAVIEILSWNKFSEYGDLVYYVGAYNYDLDVPKHFCLFDAALFFKEKYQFSKFYIINASRCNRDMSDPNQKKLSNIDFFKRGFCTHIFTRSYKTLSNK